MGLTLGTVAHAAFNPEINYQGKLTTTSNVAVADGAYHMRFRLYTALTGGTPLHVEDRSSVAGNRVSVQNGLFSVMLGSSSPLTSVDFNQTLYLEVEVGGTGSSSWETLSPRKRLGAVPAAFEASRLDGIDSTQFVRADQPGTIASTTASTLLTITQSGTGDILNLVDGATEVFTVLDGGNVGIGSTSPSQRLSVSGNAFISGNATATNITATGTLTALGNTYLQSASTTNLTISARLFDGVGAPGTTGQILQSTGIGVAWISTSTLGFLGAADINTSAELAAILSDETGTGSVVFSNVPTFTGITNMANVIFTNGTSTGTMEVTYIADTNGSVGSDGYVLRSTPTGATWVATTTLGVGAISSLNGQTGATQTFATTSSAATGWGFSSAGNTHTLNIPTAAPLIALGLLSGSDWTTFNAKLGTTSLDSSAKLAAILSDETGTGSVVFNNNPSFFGTTSINSFTATTSTTTRATSTDFFATRALFTNATSSMLGLTGVNTNAVLYTNAAGTVLGTTSLTDAYISDNITVSGATIGSNNISGTLTTTGTLTIGDGDDRIDVNSSGWDVTNSVFTGGTWQGNTISPAYGGTGLSATPQDGELLIGDGLGYTLATLTAGTGISIISGTGAITIINSSTTQWTTAGSDIYYNIGNVGIGSSTPLAKLSVGGNAVIGGNLTATGTLSVSGAATLSSTLSVVGASVLQNASTTNLSANYLAVGQSGTTTISTAGAITTPAITATAATATRATSTDLFATRAIFTGATTTSLAVTGSGSTTFSGAVNASGIQTSYLRLTGALYDASNAPGTSGQLLISNGTGATWTSTSSLAYLSSLNGLTAASQVFATSSAAGGFGFTSSGSTHTLRIPTASAGTALGLLSAADWSTFNSKLATTSIDSSAKLAGILGDETGTGNAVFSASPTLTGVATINSFIASTATTTSASSTDLFSTRAIFGQATTTNIAVTGAGTSTFTGDIDASGVEAAYFRLTGRLYDGSNSAGAAGYLLQATASGIQWIATSSLGGAGSGIINGGNAGYFTYYPSNGTTVDDQTALYLSGNNIGIGTTTPSAPLTVGGNAIISGNLQVATITATGTLSAGNASTTNLSANTFAAGQTGTTSISTTGVLTTPSFTTSGAATSTMTGGLQAANLYTTGTLRVGGGLYDSNNTRGTNGMVLQTNGTVATWVATSSLGLNGISSLNGQAQASQSFATTSAVGGFGFSSAGGIHTLNIPTASAGTALGLLSAADWSTFNAKQNALTAGYQIALNGASISSTALGTTSLDTSAELIAILGDETGSGAAVFGTSPTISGVTITGSPTASGATWTSLGTVTTVDLNGGTIDGVTIGGAAAGAITGTNITAQTNFLPDANDGAGLGQSGTAFSDLFLANGGVINWNAGDVTLTHSTDALTVAGGRLVIPNASTTEMTLTGRLFDATASAGASSSVLMSTGSGARWFATSSLGFLSNGSIDTSAELAAILTDETGSGGGFVRATSPTLVTPNLGTPSAVTLTNGTGLPISTGVSGLGSNVATFLATPSSANLISAVTDETGSGALVFANAPTFTGTAQFANSSTTNASTTLITIRKLFDNNGSAGQNGYILQSNGSTTQWVATTTLGFASGITSLGGQTGATQTFASSSAVGGFGITSSGNTHTLNIPTASAGTALGLLSAADWSTFNAKQNALTAGYQIALNGASISSTALGTTSLDTSAELIAILGDETGSGAAVFGTSPTISGVTITGSPTASGATWTSLGTVTTVDLNGGTIDGVTIGGAAAGAITGTNITAQTNFLPDANDGAGLGQSGTAFSDLFLANGGVINWNAGDVTLTHSTDALTVAGGRLVIPNASTTEMTLTGRLFDATASAGASSSVLMSTGSGARWFATSSLGFLSNGSIDTSAELAAILTDETGSGGGFVRATSPTLVTPNLGTPSAVTLTNGTGLPISTGVSGLGSNVATFLATPSSANLISAVTDETGSGALVFANAPTFTGTAQFANSSTTNASTTLITIRKLFDNNGSAGQNGYILQSNGSTTQWVATTTLGFASGITSLGGQTGATQTFASSSAVGGFGITSSGNTHTLNIPTASAGTALGLLSAADWSTFNAKQNALTAGYQIALNGASISSTALGTTSLDTSAELIAILGDETGSGAAVFGTSPTISGVTITGSPTASGATWTSLGTVTTVDLNGGTIDGVTIGGAAAGAITGTNITAQTNFLPDANDGAGLGQSGTAFSDLFLANGGVINWNAGDVTLTHSTDALTVAGGRLVIPNASTTEMTLTGRLFDATASAGASSSVLMSTGSGARWFATSSLGFLSNGSIDTSAELAAILTDETGSGGGFVRATSPTLVTPNLGTPSAVTLTNGTGLPISTGVSGLGSNVATFLATPSSANLISAVTDETGSGALVFANAPTFTGTAQFANSSTTNASTTLITIRKLFDNNGSAGQNGYILQSNGSTTQWVATTTLGFASGITSLGGQTGATQTFASSSAVGGFGITSSGNTHTLNIPTASAGTALGLLSAADWSTFNAKQNALTAGYQIALNGASISSTALGTTSLDTSAELIAILGDETGSGAAVFGTSPTISGVTITGSPTASGATWTSLGTVTTVDLNGGTIDGVTIGGAAAGAITGTNITAQTNFLPDANDGAGLGQSGTAFSDLFLANGGVINWNAGDVTLTHSTDALTVAGGRLVIPNASTTEMTLTGRLFDATASAGASSSVLMSTGSGARWFATSSLGFLARADFDTSAELAALITDETGSGAAVFGTSPTISGVTITGSPTASGATWTSLGTVTTVDLNGGTIDGVTIGGAAAGAITGTNITAQTNFLPDANDGAGLGQSGTAFSDLFLANGGVINWNAGDVTLTHSTDALTVAGGRLVIPNASTTEMTLTGRLFDATASAGASSSVLMSTGSGARWFATSSLGFLSNGSIDTCSEFAAIMTGETGTCGSVVLSASPTFTGTVNAAAATLSSTLTMSGAAANIALGSNFLSGDGDDEGVFVNAIGNVGIGSTSPHARLSIDTSSLGTTSAFVIGSSTRTLLTVTNSGQLIMGTSSITGTPAGATSTRFLMAGGSFFQQFVATNTVGSMNIAGGVKDATNLNAVNSIEIVGRYAYLSRDFGFSIVDINDPQNPTLVGYLTEGVRFSGSDNVVVSGNYAYVTNYFTASLAVIDISDPRAPYVLGYLTNPELDAVSGLAISGNYAYASTDLGFSVVIIDISNPGAPTVAGVMDAPGRLTDITIAGKYAYAVSSNFDEFYIFDITNPVAPVVLDILTDASNLNGAYSVKALGKYAYVANSVDDSLRIIDVSNPSAAVIVGGVKDTVNLDFVTSVVLSGRYAYLTSFNNDSLRVVDISSTTNPILVSGIRDTVNLDGISDVAISGRYAYVTSATDDSLRAIDLGGIDSPGGQFGSLLAGNIDVTGRLTGDAAYLRMLGIGGGGILSNGLGAFSVNATTSLTGTHALTATVNDTRVSSIADVLSLTHTATGTIANGIGTGIIFKTEISGTAAASTTATSTARIASVLTDVTSTNPQSALAFYTKNGGTSDLAERMRLTATGNLGLGSTSPNWQLTVASTVPMMALNDSDAGVNAKNILFFLNNGTFSIASSTDNFSATTSLMSITSASTTFARALAVQSTGTSTFANGINLSTGCFAVNGTCVGGGAGSGTVNTGAAGFLAYYPSAGTTVDDQTTLYLNTTNNTLGVGTTSPHARLSVDTTSLGTTSAFLIGSSTRTLFKVENTGVVLVNTTSNIHSNNMLSVNGTIGIANSQLYQWGDSSTAIWGDSSSDFLATFTAGAERTRIINNGNMGIGSSSPHARLSVDTTSLGTTSAFLIGSSTNTLFKVANNGNVSIGTPDAYAKFVISGGTNFQHLVFSPSSDTLIGGSGSGLRTSTAGFELNVDTNSSAFINVDTDNNSSANSFQVRFDGSVTPSLLLTDPNINLALGIGTTSPHARLSVDTTSLGTTSAFLIGSSTGTLFRVANNGFVGIGSSTPGNALVVSAAAGSQVATFGDGNTNYHIGMAGTGGTARAMFGHDASSSNVVVQGNSGRGIEFNVNNGVFGDGTAAVINSAGYMGVGTSSPAARFTVWGASTGTTKLVEYVNSASTTLAHILEDGTAYFRGNVGIGTTSPARKLDITEASSVAQLRLSKSISQYVEFTLDSVGDLAIDATGGDIRFTSDNVFICEGGSCPTSTATSTAGNLFVENAITIGDGFSLRQIDTTNLGMYDVGGELIMIFDEGT